MKNKIRPFFDLNTWDKIAWLLVFLFIFLFVFIDPFSKFFFKDELCRGEYLTKILLPCLASLIAVVGMGLTIKRTDAMQNEVDITKESLEQIKQQDEKRNKQILEEFTHKKNIDETNILETRLKNAMEHLGSDNPNISFGGIYELDSIARDSKKYTQRILNILCSYVRFITNKTNQSTKCFDEEWIMKTLEERSVIRPNIIVQEIINIIFAPKTSVYKEFSANFADSNLQSVCFIGLEVNRAIFNNSAMHYAQMYTNKDEQLVTKFKNCSFNKTYLHGVNMSNTEFDDCLFKEARMCWTNLYGCSLKKCNFENADMTCTILTNSILNSCNFWECTFDGAEIANNLTIKSEYRKNCFNKASFKFASVFYDNWLNNCVDLEINHIEITGMVTNNQYYHGYSRIKRLTVYKYIEETPNINHKFDFTYIDNKDQKKREEYYSLIINKVIQYAVNNNSAERELSKEIEALKAKVKRDKIEKDKSGEISV